MRIIEFEKIDSTQIFAKSLKTPKTWTVILAREQTAGRGRGGNFWYSPQGGLYFSVILPKSKIEDLQTLNILAAFIVARAIKENFDLEPMIKLPNDVLINGKKVCGILTKNIIQREVKFSAMGIGLNTNIEKFPKDLEKIATSLKIELGKEVDNKKILEQIVKGLKEQLRTIRE
jgi:BirA family biotin operon repressor/biotin-[acetyl-CoA-carboxylase] ligase